MVPEEKKAMLQEIANQKGVSCRAQGWKVHLCAAQLLQLVGRILVVVMYCCREEQMLEAFAFIEYFLLSNSEAFPINKGHAEFLCVTYNIIITISISEIQFKHILFWYPEPKYIEQLWCKTYS